jgi:hypothetical protein
MDWIEIVVSYFKTAITGITGIAIWAESMETRSNCETVEDSAVMLDTTGGRSILIVDRDEYSLRFWLSFNPRVLRRET